MEIVVLSSDSRIDQCAAKGMNESAESMYSVLILVHLYPLV